MTKRLAALAALALLAGCNRIGPMVGGPCEYETFEFATTVVANDGENITVAGPGGDTFNIPASAFETRPAVGEAVRVQKDSITKGTCTPIIFRPV